MTSRRAEPHMDPEALRTVVKRLDEQLEKVRAEAAKLEDRSRGYEELRSILQDLPEKVTHPVMVPFGPLAFFEGHLEHTNEVLVQLSSEYFALKTAKHALGTVDRRMLRVKQDQSAVAKEVDELKQKRRLAVGERTANHIDGASVTEDADGFLDIREPYIETETQPSSSSDVKGDDICANAVSENVLALEKLREMERMEEEDELRELDDIVERYESSHGDSTSDTNQAASAFPPAVASSGGYPEVRSPSDLYRLMADADQTIRGNERCIANASTSFAHASPMAISGATEMGSVQLPPSSKAATKAFTGEICERGHVQSSKASSEATAPKRVSKFKSERQRIVGSSPP